MGLLMTLTFNLIDLDYLITDSSRALLNMTTRRKARPSPRSRASQRAPQPSLEKITSR